MDREDFIYSTQPCAHRARARQILADHPDVRKLIGKCPEGFAAILAILAAQFGIAFYLADKPWWMILGAAYAIGAFCNHGLYVLIHECSHRLIFKTRTANRIAGIIADLPNVFPTSIAFERYHSKHHAFQGVYGLDLGVPSRWEARLFGGNWYGKGLWLLLYPILQTFRLFRYNGADKFDLWVVLNCSAQAASAALVLVLLGPWALLYLAASFFFSIGFHPLGARWISEHTFFQEEQETYSYYGPLNLVMFNIGYHAEHHDFPSVPWNRLPALRKAAPEYYASLTSYRSLSSVWVRFLLGRQFSLFSVIVRRAPVRGGRPQ